MEIKMNRTMTFDELAEKIGCSVEELKKKSIRKRDYR